MKMERKASRLQPAPSGKRVRSVVAASAPRRAGKVLELKGRGQRQAPARLELRPVVSRVKQHAAVVVGIDFHGVDRVDLEVEPSGTFSLDTRALAGPGQVRLLAQRDGIATLIAVGRAGGRPVIERMVHVQCDGPTVRILAIGYTAPRA